MTAGTAVNWLTNRARGPASQGIRRPKISAATGPCGQAVPVNGVVDGDPSRCPELWVCLSTRPRSRCGYATSPYRPMPRVLAPPVRDTGSILDSTRVARADGLLGRRGCAVRGSGRVDRYQWHLTVEGAEQARVALWNAESVTSRCTTSSTAEVRPCSSCMARASTTASPRRASILLLARTAVFDASIPTCRVWAGRRRPRRC